jgi:HEAT repeat protein
MRAKIVVPVVAVVAVVAIWLLLSARKPPKETVDQADGSAAHPAKVVMAPGASMGEVPKAGNMSDRLKAMREARSKRKDVTAPQGGSVDARQPEGGFVTGRLTTKHASEPDKGAQQAMDDLDAEDLRTVQEALASANPEDRVDALESLELFDDEVALGLLKQGLTDSEAQVRLAALEQIGVMVDEPPIDVLATAVRDSDPEIRSTALGMLAESEDDARWPLIENARFDTDEDVRSDAEDIISENAEDESANE